MDCSIQPSGLLDLTHSLNLVVAMMCARLDRVCNFETEEVNDRNQWCDMSRVAQWGGVSEYCRHVAQYSGGGIEFCDKILRFN